MPSLTGSAPDDTVSTCTADPAAGGFLRPAPPSPGADQMFAADVDRHGYVTTPTRLWAHVPAADTAIRTLLDTLAGAGGLTERQCAIIGTTTAAARADASGSLVWGTRLARHVGPHVAGEVLRGIDDHLDESDAALARWARRVVATPNGTSGPDVDELRQAGFGDTAIFAVTAFAALRMAFSTVNSALGGRPDAAIAQFAPHPVRNAVTYGRTPDIDPPRSTRVPGI